MTVVHAFQRKHGSRNIGVSRVLKRLLQWEKDHNCRIDIVYVQTDFNEADGPRYE